MIQIAANRFHAATLAVATVLTLGGCRAHYLGSYDASDGEVGAAGAATGGGGSGVATGGAGAAGAGVGGAGGSEIDASVGDADAGARSESGPDGVATESGADAPNVVASGDGSTFDGAPIDAACTGVLLPEPAANYSFDDCDDARGSLRDTSKHAADANKEGGVRCAGGRSGIAVFFNGDDVPGNGYLTVPGPDVPSFSNALTISAWFSVWDNRYANLLGRWFGDDSFLLLSDGNDFVFSIATPDGEGGVGLDYHVKAPLVLYRWVHVVAVFDGGSQAIYVDGKLAQKAPVEPMSALQTTMRPLQMGGLDVVGSFFKGLIDEVRLYDVALDAAQVRELDCGL